MANAPTPNIGLTLPVQGQTPWDAINNGNFTIIDNCLGGVQTIPALALAGTLTKVGGVPTVAGGVAAILAKVDLTAQAANVGSSLLYAVPANGAGMYCISAYAVITQAAAGGTPSSTLPSIQVVFTDNDTGVTTGPQVLTNTNTGNTVGFFGAAAAPLPFGGVMNCKASTNINYSTTGYASTSTPTPMQYAIHVKLQYLGL